MSDAAEGQQHPLSIYYAIWVLLFVLSIFSYMVDYFQFQGYLRWALILIFMMLKDRFYCGNLHAYGLGTAGPDHSDIVATAGVIGADCIDGH